MTDISIPFLINTIIKNERHKIVGEVFRQTFHIAVITVEHCICLEQMWLFWYILKC